MIALLRRDRNFARLIAAYAQSQIGTGAGFVALMLVTYHRLHSGWAVALVLLCDFLPGIALAAVFGALADRMPRRRLAVGADTIRAAAFAGIAFVPSFGATLAFALIAGAGTAAFRPAATSALGTIVDAEDRSRATAWWSLCSNAGVLMGPALTAPLLLVMPPSTVLLLNAATFALSASLLSRVDLGEGTAERGDTRTGWVAEVREGLGVVRRLPGVSLVITGGALSVLAAALMNPAEPLFATGSLHGGPSAYAVLVACYGMGMIGGSIVNARLGGAVADLRRRWLLGMAIEAVGLAGSALAPAVAVAALTFLITGWGNTFIAGAETRMLQELAPERLIGRAFGVYEVFGNLAFVVAFVSAGIALSYLGPRWVFAFGATLVTALAIGCAARLRKTTAEGCAPVVPAMVG